MERDFLGLQNLYTAGFERAVDGCILENYSRKNWKGNTSTKKPTTQYIQWKKKQLATNATKQKLQLEGF